MERSARIEIVSAILASSHIINTSKTEESFHEIMNLHTRHYSELNKILPWKSYQYCFHGNG